MGGESKRGKDKEAEWQRMAVIRWLQALSACDTTSAPQLTDLILNSLRGWVDRTLCSYSIGPKSKLLLLLPLCGQHEGEQRLVQRFFIPLTFEARLTDNDTCNDDAH